MDINETYRQALLVAQGEFDELLPEMQRMATRLRHLRLAIGGLSGLLGNEVTPPYQFIQVPPPMEHRLQDDPRRAKEGR